MAFVASFNLDGVPADELDNLLSAQAEELRCRVA